MTKPSSDILSLSHMCERVRSFLLACWPFHLGHMKWNLFASPILTTWPKSQSSTKTYCLRQGSRNLLPPAHCLSLGGVLADSPSASFPSPLQWFVSPAWPWKRVSDCNFSSSSQKRKKHTRYCKADRTRSTMAYGRGYRKGTNLLLRKAATRGLKELRTTHKVSSSLGLSGWATA